LSRACLGKIVIVLSLKIAKIAKTAVLVYLDGAHLCEERRVTEPALRRLTRPEVHLRGRYLERGGAERLQQTVAEILRLEQQLL
jgi:hypothetical protein